MQLPSQTDRKDPTRRRLGGSGFPSPEGETAEAFAAEIELRRLPQDYAAAVDRRDVTGLLDLFLPDARLTVVRGREGAEEYRGHEELPSLIDRLAECEATLHEVVNHQLELDGSEATGEVSCIAHHVTRHPGFDARDLVMYLRYCDSYRRDQERWRFACRRLVVDWTELRRVRLP
ncbi:MAG TPA: nuclear transport factor 2 family protein [Solirubrobacterales bacterium]|nr:nuclear transport factor 2 family protein [Solirubrobacterales bacterium]